MKLTQKTPTATPLEETTLGAIMLSPDESFELMGDTFNPDAFYTPKNRLLAHTIKTMRGSGAKVDMLTLVPYILKSKEWTKYWDNIGECAYYISTLTNGVASSANIAYHMLVLREKHLGRELLKMFNQHTSQIAQGFDAIEVFDKMKAQLEAIDNKQSAGDIQHISEVEVLADIVEAHNNPGKTGIPTGLAEQDKLTGGWQKGELVLLGARPAMGKTSLALCYAIAAAEASHGVGIISLEMTNKQLKRRLVAMKSRLSSSDIKRGNTTKDDLMVIEEAEKKLNELPMHFQESAYRKHEIQRSIRILVKKGCKVVIIDYAQQMKEDEDSRSMNRNMELESITLMIQRACKLYNIPIIVLSQLSRPIKGVKVQPPTLSDLKDSGSLEQCANVVMFIHRPDYYEDKPIDDNTGQDVTGLGKIIIAKNRDGAIGYFWTKFVPHLTLFQDIDEDFDFSTIPDRQSDKKEVPF